MSEVKEKNIMQDEGIKVIANVYRDGNDTTKHIMIGMANLLLASQEAAEATNAKKTE